MSPDSKEALRAWFLGPRGENAELLERLIVEAQWEQSLRQLEHISIPRVLWAGYRVWPCVAVCVRATASFDQTPGPGAGAPVT